MICGTPGDWNLTLETDHPEMQPLIFFGLGTFDNIFFGFITIFVMVTLEGWSKIMYNIMDASIPSVGVIGCVLVVVLCGFFLVNIILAVLAESISEDELVEENLKKHRDLVT
jgi:hypothetical protein